MKSMKHRECLAVLVMIWALSYGAKITFAQTDLTTYENSPTVLVQGSPLHGANGIMFDSDDRLHIASVVGREIVIMDPETGEILDRLGPNVGVEGPDDLTFGPDSSLYWTSLFTGEVGRLSDGVKTGQFVAPGVNPITFSDDGRLFVALDFLGDALYELDPDLVDPPRLIAESLGFLNGFDFGPDGFLYGPIFTLGQVVRIDVDLGTIDTVADGFGVPAAVKFDSQGRLHVVDLMMGQVSRVDTETGSKEVIAQLTPGLDNLAFDSSDRLFVSHGFDGSIFEVLSDGTTRTVSPGGMIVPGGVAVLSGAEGEPVFVADVWTLREFDGLTGEQRSVEPHVFVPGMITSPMTVSPDGDHLVLSSWFGNAVQIWNPETREVLEEYLDFAVPMNAIRFQGDLVVPELLTGSVVRRIDGTGERDTLASGLFVPVGLAATDDDVWVSDWATGLVLQIVADGVVLSPTIPVATGLLFPEGLAVDLDGNLLVVETGAGRVSHIDLATGEISTVAEGLELGAQGVPDYPPTWMFNGVAVGQWGAIYVTGDVANVLYRIELPAAAITSVLDAPNDQGKQVRISWRSSFYDSPYAGDSVITEYSIWRRVDKDSKGTQNSGFLRSKDTPPGSWDFVTTVPAVQDPIYNCVVPTLVDSTKDAGIQWSVFFVRAHTKDPLVHWESAPDSGYSVDNLAPSTPANLLYQIVAEGTKLFWSSCPDEDFRYFAIYKDTVPISPNALEPFATTIDTFHLDTDLVIDRTYYYRISAFDFAGNESELSEEVSVTITGISADVEGGLPRSYAIAQNYPSPFSAKTTISYQLPVESDVSLKIYSFTGQLVRTLVNVRKKAGYYNIVWDGRDNNGKKVVSGIYFYKIQAHTDLGTGNYTSTRKMILMR